MEKHFFQKKTFQLSRVWPLALFILVCGVFYTSIVSERRYTAEETKDGEETEFQRSMPFPLLPALEVSGLFPGSND